MPSSPPVGIKGFTIFSHAADTTLGPYSTIAGKSFLAQSFQSSKAIRSRNFEWLMSVVSTPAYLSRVSIVFKLSAVGIACIFFSIKLFSAASASFLL